MGEVQQITRQDENWVKAEVVAKHLACSAVHVRVMARTGRIPGRNIGMGKKPFWVFRISQVDAALEKAVAS